jgi:TRAP-type C4-dicarboxylate transport system substrate-binding protein
MVRKNAFLKIGLWVTLSLFGFALAAAAPAAAADKIVLKAISAWATNHESVVDDFLPWYEKTSKMLKEKFPGQVEINYLGGPEVIPTKDQAEALRNGVVHLYFGTDAYYAGIAPEANISKMTQLYGWEEKERGVNAALDEIHRKKLNATYVGRLGNELGFQLYLNKEVQKVEDIKGLRIRCSPMQMDFVLALGGTPIETSPGDVYQALERNVVDGFMWPLVTIRTWGWHEVTKYVVGPSYYKQCHPILINVDAWNKLPEPVRNALADSVEQEGKIVEARDIEKGKNEYTLLEKAGLKVITFSPEDTQKYLDLANSSGWEGHLKRTPEAAAKLRPLLTR